MNILYFRQYQGEKFEFFIKKVISILLIFWFLTNLLFGISEKGSINFSVFLETLS